VILPNWLSHTYAIVGIVVSLIGTALTIIFARAARDSADQAVVAASAAKEAAEAARVRMLNVDLLFETTKIAGMLDELHGTIGQQTWFLVVDRANRACDEINSVIMQTQHVLDEETRANLAQAGSQLRTLAATADRAAFEKSYEPDVRRFRRVVSQQKEIVVVAIENLREAARSGSV
jgi:hypothetical protein